MSTTGIHQKDDANALYSSVIVHEDDFVMDHHQSSVILPHSPLSFLLNRKRAGRTHLRHPHEKTSKPDAQTGPKIDSFWHCTDVTNISSSAHEHHSGMYTLHRQRSTVRSNLLATIDYCTLISSFHIKRSRNLKSLLSLIITTKSQHYDDFGGSL